MVRIIIFFRVKLVNVKGILVTTFMPHTNNFNEVLWLKPFFLRLQHSEEMYDPEIYRHQISEYYNPYVLEADIQAGEFNFDIVPSNGTCSIRSFYFRKRANVTTNTI